MRKRKKDLDAYEEDMVNISKKEQEILDSYNEEYVEYNEKVKYEDEEFDYKEEPVIEEKISSKKSKEKIKEEIVIIEDEEDTEEEIEQNEDSTENENEYIEYIEKKPINYKKIINVCFTIIMIILVIITIDVIGVAKYEKGPFFAIPTKEYKDGGTKEYLGLGYKVIKYNQIQGRRDKEIGFWNLKYNAEPLNIQDIDLAIEFNKDETGTYKKYYKKFIRIESTLESIDIDKNSIVIGYNDEGKKYTLKVRCDMACKTEELANINVNEKVYVIGTVRDFKYKTDKTPRKLTLSDCFASR